MGPLVVNLGPVLLLTQKPKMRQAGLNCMKASQAQEKGGQEFLCHYFLLNKEEKAEEIISDLSRKVSMGSFGIHKELNQGLGATLIPESELLETDDP